MLTGIFVTVMDGSIVNVAIPSIRTTLGATFAEAELVVAGYIFVFTPVLNAVLSGIQDRFVGAAAGVLTTMQRGGNAIGMALLEIPFAATLDHARAAGFPNPVAYVHAFMAVSFCIVVMVIAVIVLLCLLQL